MNGDRQVMHVTGTSHLYMKNIWFWFEVNQQYGLKLMYGVVVYIERTKMNEAKSLRDEKRTRNKKKAAKTLFSIE